MNIPKDKDLIRTSESSVEFYLHKNDIDEIPAKSMNVFYNKKMELNRDITLLAILGYNKIINPDPLKIVDSMVASGIGSIRLLKASNNIGSIVLNDINPSAIHILKKSLKLNDINLKRIILSINDANYLFLKITKGEIKDENSSIFNPNVILIDPFGTPNRYIDSALKAIQKQNGLLCVTATDTPVLFGVKPKACLRKYMTKPLHTEFCKELGARILLYFVSRIANINNLAIIPLLTFYSNHFIRIFVITSKSKEKINNIINKNYGYIIHCSNCGYRISVPNNPLNIMRNCPICSKSDKLDYSGPIWIGELHNPTFLKEIISLGNKFEFANKKRINKLLNYTLEEIGMPISYYNIHKLCQKFKISNIPNIEELINLLRTKGYRSSRTHFDFISIKTNADIALIEKCLLELNKK